MTIKSEVFKDIDPIRGILGGLSHKTGIIIRNLDSRYLKKIPACNEAGRGNVRFIRELDPPVKSEQIIKRDYTIKPIKMSELTDVAVIFT